VTDRRTDGQNPSGYYSALHCKQCGGAVKIAEYLNNFNNIIISITIINLKWAQHRVPFASVLYRAALLFYANSAAMTYKMLSYRRETALQGAL